MKNRLLLATSVLAAAAALVSVPTGDAVAVSSSAMEGVRTDRGALDIDVRDHDNGLAIPARVRIERRAAFGNDHVLSARDGKLRAVLESGRHRLYVTHGPSGQSRACSRVAPG